MKSLLAALVGALLFPALAMAAPAAVLVDPNGVPIAGTNPLPVTAGAAPVASTDASGTVTTGNTYQTVFASSTSRRGCLIQNPTTATEVLNVRVASAAVFTIPAGGSFNCANPGGQVISDKIEVTAATTAHAFTAISQ